MARELVLSGLLVVILPMLLGINGVWISPASNPDEIVSYALTDMIIEKQGLL